jgi:DNA-binding response OmpR family regulator
MEFTFPPAEKGLVALNTTSKGQTKDMQQAVHDLTPLKSKNALVVDSALATRRALQDQLSQLGARTVVFASSVAEVEQQLSSREFSLLICEYQLEGERNGQQLLEDLRLNRKLSWSTAFMMVTGERSYSKVVAVAEFEPDDYLIKPFTASKLSDRVVRIFNRKKRLEEVYKAVFTEEHTKVPPLCDKLIIEFPQYKNTLQRMKVEAFYHLNTLLDAETELINIMGNDPKPWMLLLMAKVHMARKDFNHAAELLQNVVKTNPEYMAASDLFADVLWEKNSPQDALDVLEKLGAKGMDSTIRLRKMADLAVRVRDHSRSKTYLTKLIDRSRNTNLSQMNDVLQLSKIYISEGKPEEAEKLAARLRTSVQSEQLEMARSMMNIQKDIADGKKDRAIEKLEELFEAQQSNIDGMEPETLTNLLEMCFAVNMQGRGYELARHISKKKPGKALLERIRFSIEDFKRNSV